VSETVVVDQAFARVEIENDRAMPPALKVVVVMRNGAPV